MNLVVTADENWGIRYQGHPLTSIPAELKSLQTMITGQVVVMDDEKRKELPGEHPLLHCRNLILTQDLNLRLRGPALCHSLQELKKEMAAYPSDRIYIIGGPALYREFYPLCAAIHVTRLHHTFTANETFPALDRDSDWCLAEESEEQTCFDLEYTFQKYIRKA